MNQELALNLFQYKDGKLFWKVNPVIWRNLQGKEAGSIGSRNYLNVMFKGKNYKAHRLIWLMHYGDIPSHLTVDHLNRDTSDNRIENLRLATASQQAHNTDGKGYTFVKGRYKARIRINKKLQSIGSYVTEHGARMAYLMRKLQWNLAHKTA